jgi:acyl phosphate:glycerol-3-phosphate acyltransferase
MNIFIVIICAIGAYLIGSIPTAVWYARRFHKLEIKEHGSGNAGATNTFRVLGARSGLIVLMIDILKGWLATRLANVPVWFDAIPENQLTMYKLIFGIIAVLGHIYPVYENFKGGKGVATLLGMVLAIQLNVALACFLVFVVVFSFSKYVSLGSMLAAIAYPILLYTKVVPPHTNPQLMTGFGIVMALLVIYTHRKNVTRLLKGEENKTYLNKKSN